MANNSGSWKGFAYPIIKGPKGFFGIQSGINQIKSDLLILLLTSPGERVMLPTFGTPLKDLIFEPGDASLVSRARQMIINSITQWEPRIAARFGLWAVPVRQYYVFSTNLGRGASHP